MRTAASALLSIALGACAGPHHVPRVEVPPPHWVEPAGSTFRGDSSVHFLPSESASKLKGAAPADPKSQSGADSREAREAETVRFLESEIQRKTPPPL